MFDAKDTDDAIDKATDATGCTNPETDLAIAGIATAQPE